VRFWVLKCIVFFALAGAINMLLPPLATRLFAGRTLFDLTALPTVAGVLIGLVALDFVSYWFHRVKHTSPVLWRGLHQLHHSAERVDVAGFSYTHPLELALNIVMAAVVGGVLGLAPAATAIVGYITFMLGIFQHSNIATPVWLGYLVQRPECHALHHARGIHAFNYGWLALWDAVFGTWRNPREFAAEAGFWDGASRRVVPLLVGRDVTQAIRDR
jgi:sterol desaturase/sphingolipid hydroxylase (fatty acid hydroxylase superfamily)